MRTVNRREFLQLAAAPLLARGASADLWRTFEITTRVQILKPSGPTRVWLPMPLAVAPYQKTLGDTYHAQGGAAVMAESEDLDILVAEWDDGVEPVLAVTNRVMTMDRAANLATPTVPPPLDGHALDRYTRPTKLLPTDGIVKATASTITRGAGTDIERARASTSGSSTTPFAIRRRAAAAPATSASCSSRRTSAASARISTRSSSAFHAPRASRRATSGASASPGRKRICAASACRPTMPRKRSTAAPRSISPATAGCRSTPPTSARSRSRNHPAISRWTTRKCAARADGCSDPGR